MTTPIDLAMPRSTILKFPSQTQYIRPTVQKGTLQVPAGVTMVQILWNGAAQLRVLTENPTATLIGAWTLYKTAPSSGEYQYFRVVSSQSTALVIQGITISEDDLTRELAVNFIPMTA